MARNEPVIWVKREADYFCKRDWTGQISLKALRKITPARTSIENVSGKAASALRRIPDSKPTSRLRNRVCETHRRFEAAFTNP
jgi:hypothetical protein